jgi:hypothetical protein
MILGSLVIKSFRLKLFFAYVAALILVEIFYSRIFVLLEWSHGFFLAIIIGTMLLLLHEAKSAGNSPSAFRLGLFGAVISTGLTLAVLSRPSDAVLLFAALVCFVFFQRNYLGFLLLITFMSFAQFVIVLEYSDFLIYEEVTSVSLKGHPFWHSLLSGIGWMEILTNLPYADDTGKALALKYTGYAYPGALTLEYEESARQAFFAIISANPWMAIKAYILKMSYCFLQVAVFCVFPFVLFYKEVSANLRLLKPASVVLLMIALGMTLAPGVLVWPSRSYIPVSVAIFGVFAPFVLNLIARKEWWSER